MLRVPCQCVSTHLSARSLCTASALTIHCHRAKSKPSQPPMLRRHSLIPSSRDKSVSSSGSRPSISSMAASSPNPLKNPAIAHALRSRTVNDAPQGPAAFGGVATQGGGGRNDPRAWHACLPRGRVREILRRGRECIGRRWRRAVCAALTVRARYLCVSRIPGAGTRVRPCLRWLLPKCAAISAYLHAEQVEAARAILTDVAV